jgi:hypothetical protein
VDGKNDSFIKQQISTTPSLSLFMFYPVNRVIDIFLSNDLKAELQISDMAATTITIIRSHLPAIHRKTTNA